MIETNRKESQRRVRVAILDTGVDITHPDMQAALERNQLVARGFPASLDPFRDRHGHGTHGVSVILKTAPNVVVYIARMVDDDGKIMEEGEYLETVKV